MRVSAPIKVSIFAFLSLFRLNIYVTLGRGIGVSLSLHRHSLRLPHEGLSKAVAGISVFAAVNLHSDPRRLETLRQLYGLVVILKVTEGVCQAHAPGRAYFRKAQHAGFALQQPVEGDHGAAGHLLVRLSGLHEHELEVELTRGSLRYDLHLLHLHVNERVRLHQTAVKRQILVQARNLTLHVAETALDLLIALAIDPPRHFGGFQLAALLLVLRLEAADARARDERSTHRIDHAKSGVVSAELERRVQKGGRKQHRQTQQHRAKLRRMRSDDQLAEIIRHPKACLSTGVKEQPTLYEAAPFEAVLCDAGRRHAAHPGLGSDGRNPHALAQSISC